MSLQHQKIYLLGFMGCGKSTIGKALSEKLKIKFMDLDEMIEMKRGKSVAEIFSVEGEQAFRELESETLNNIDAAESLVISLGGGTPCFNDNMNRVRASGISIYLHLQPAQLAARLENEKNHRPLIKEAGNLNELTKLIEEKLTKRENFYLQANHIINADNSVEKILDKITCLLSS